MIDVRRLRLLRELSVQGTVTAAAEALHLTGPAVSQQLAALEKEAGVPLLEKHGRTLRLTYAGQRLVEHADVILGNLAAADAELQALRAGQRGTVLITAFPSAARVLLPPLWQLLAQDSEAEVGDVGAMRPELRITEAEPDVSVEMLRRRETDIAVAHAYSLLPRPLPPGCEQHRLMEEPVYLALHPDTAAAHDLTPHQPAELADFRDEGWLLPDPRTYCHELTRRACGAAGFVPSPIAAATDFSVLTALVAARAGVALVPRMALPADTRGVSLHPLTAPVTRSVYALARSGEAGQPRLSRVLEGLQTVALNQYSVTAFV
ncbi:transcriptional regulator, LysR family [Catenulispora acidiphila DSM 44928]|uniref:Transcriptional regulator, LysR family n=1 Tax=Catenulispora acidiphila (strain DSM 44928 / JCM 14897 / NBRC 102108 / NRRL B-24433 / ID139908) TaxID=479433 RepID=C7QGB9_CATAD|nr:LysR substrate-binding domain-containing protein [Catenulispora acidiphila]ACU72964.1 transcriptional regulator, LysR family [Catenulispora acidiphila DSM 44928]